MLSHLFVATMAVVMLFLGFWQLDRLDDRKERNDEVRAAMEVPALDVEEALGEPVPDQTAVLASGEYLEESSFFVANRSYERQAGVWLATPLRLGDGRIVVVSRGWVPRLWDAGEDPREIVTPRGSVEVLGRIHQSVDGGRIGGGTGSTLPEVSRPDMEQVSEMIGLDVVDQWIQLERQAPPVEELPIPVPPPGLDEGPHLSYAFQWFFFSFATMVAYGLILRRQRREHEIAA
jgi:surfeit locus 1 family protein